MAMTTGIFLFAKPLTPEENAQFTAEMVALFGRPAPYSEALDLYYAQKRREQGIDLVPRKDW